MMLRIGGLLGGGRGGRCFDGGSVRVGCWDGGWWIYGRLDP